MKLKIARARFANWPFNREMKDLEEFSVALGVAFYYPPPLNCIYLWCVKTFNTRMKAPERPNYI